MIYKMTWKQKVTPRGRSYYQLVASAHRTSGKESGLSLSGWVTPTQRDWKDTAGMATEAQNPDGSKRSRIDQLPRQAQLASFAGINSTSICSENMVAQIVKVAGWPTPIVNDMLGSTHCYSGKNPDGSHKIAWKLPGAAKQAGWPTPQAIDASGKGRDGRLKKDGNRNPNLPGSYRRDLKDQAMTAQPMRLTASGEILTGSSAEMESGGQLNPRFSGFLMGYPTSWCVAAILAQRAIPSRKTKRREP